jgi:hypothetical protein
VKVLFFLLFVTGCASKMLGGSPREGKSNYSFTDVSGTYKLQRETKTIKQRVITRSQLISSNKVLEKSILVSQIGSIKGQKSRLLVVRPEASEFTVWLEGKKYSSRMKINPRTKAMIVSLESPEAKWKGTSEIKFPSGKYFCFYNQIPECLYHNYLLNRAYSESTKIDFHVIWDSYPFVQDQLSQVGKSLFTPASVKFDGEIKGLFRYIVEVEGQMILYMFTKNYDLSKVSWITQGITIVPPGEEIADDE